MWVKTNVGPPVQKNRVLNVLTSVLYKDPHPLIYRTKLYLFENCHQGFQNPFNASKDTRLCRNVFSNCTMYTLYCELGSNPPLPPWEAHSKSEPTHFHTLFCDELWKLAAHTNPTLFPHFFKCRPTLFIFFLQNPRSLWHIFSLTLGPLGLVP